MECTQRLESTQVVCSLQPERTCPEQIGFLGACGTKYPVNLGLNTIGRDPQICNIVLNANSISRRHAIINILNETEFMLFDVESANKTKLNNKILQPFIPQQLKNGDIVQFGDVFGIFRILEDESNLPMTQIIDIPDTPVFDRHNISKLNNLPSTTIPESPDISDRDDSFIVPSQPNAESQFKTPNNRYIKPSAIQPIGSNKIDNIYWNSSKKSTSFNSSVGLKDAATDEKTGHNIHEMNTQLVYSENSNESKDSIYLAETQVPIPQNDAPSIHTLDTQLTEHELHFDLHTSNKENDNSIHNAETQLFVIEKEHNVSNETTENFFHNKSPSKSKGLCGISGEKHAESDEEIAFDAIDSQHFENFESQPLLPPEMSICKENIKLNETTQQKATSEKTNKTVKRAIRDNRTQLEDIFLDCDDIDTPTQKIQERRIQDDSTDCEDNLIEIEIKPFKKPGNPPQKDGKVRFEDMATQIVEEIVIEKNANKSVKQNADLQIDFADLPTQIIDQDISTTGNCSTVALQSEQAYSEEIVKISPFKIPLQSPIRIKMKDIPKLAISIPTSPTPEMDISVCNEDERNYYAATQELLGDLCSQKELSPEIVKISSAKMINNNELETNNGHTLDDELIPCSVEDYQTIIRLPNIESPSPKKKNVADKCSSSDDDANINTYISSLSKEQIKHVIGLDEQISTPKKMSSSISDPDETPKKVRPFKIIDVELPDSQEIKSCVSLSSKIQIEESFTDSEVEDHSEEQNTPIVFQKKSKQKLATAKIDLTKRFETGALPTRVITRVRKPTNKIQHSFEENKYLSKDILRSKLITRAEENLDKEIINENLARLKSKNDQIKHKRNTENDENTLDSKKELDKGKTNNNNITTQNYKVEPKEEQQKNKVNESIEKNCKKKTTSNLNETKTITNDIKKYIKPIEKNSNEAGQSKHNRTSTEKINNTKQVTANNDLSVTNKNIRSTRSSRSENTKENVNKIENKSESAHNSKRDTKLPEKVDKEKHAYKKKHEKPSPVKKQEIRRSKRQKPMDKKIQYTDENLKVVNTRSRSRGKEEKREQSTVYNISSESDGVSTLKTAIKDLTTEPNPKRSRRHKGADNKEKEMANRAENLKQKSRSEAKKNETKHVQNTISDLTSKSNDLPKTLKRSAKDDTMAPNPKRTRSNISYNNSLSSSTPKRFGIAHRIVFTGVFPTVIEQCSEKLKTLGAEIVTDVNMCTVVVALKLKRTCKLLCAVGLGRPIVGLDWVQACIHAKTLTDPWLYLIKDEEAESRFQFNLRETLASERKYLRGYNVSSTKQARPPADEMKLIVECSGGNWKEGGPRWICVSTMNDGRQWPALKRRGAIIVSSEFILCGVLRQRIDLDMYKLG